ncbi:hypothetical protein CALVIDRAFT_245668 [Calocera viscosa TUFC12733]|uniref:RBR-type E3 ubiquitin transferase n=1 Tax=Calocera viscosa (strain TUFC12733) TaxID=1330018 RepID=A0A167JI96_CALVF|nr:hypothetical protein CALVIDRAFT_245668 [Calocera viscosa TUFC12733]
MPLPTKAGEFLTHWNIPPKPSGQKDPLRLPTPAAGDKGKGKGKEVQREWEVTPASLPEPERCPACGYRFTCASCVRTDAAAWWAVTPSSLPDAPWCPTWHPPLWIQKKDNPDPKRERDAGPSGPGPGPADEQESARHTIDQALIARGVQVAVRKPATDDPLGAAVRDRPPTPYPAAATIAAAHLRSIAHCTVCDRWVDMPRRQATVRCVHDERVCEECLRTYLAYQTDKLAIRCPIPSCPESLELADVQRWADREVFDHYDQFLLRRHLAEEPSFSWCKNPACKSGQLHAPEAATCTLVTCHACAANWCSAHDIPWHEGMTCAQYDQSRRGWLRGEQWKERKVRLWVKRKTKKCPGCGTHIERSEGCDHITCYPPGGCGYHFCWRCGADYSLIFRIGNHGHKRWCKHHRPERGWRWAFWRPRERWGVIEVW